MCFFYSLNFYFYYKNPQKKIPSTQRYTVEFTVSKYRNRIPIKSRANFFTTQYPKQPLLLCDICLQKQKTNKKKTIKTVYKKTYPVMEFSKHMLEHTYTRTNT